MTAQVKGRQKKAYSVFRKMQSKSLSFEQLSDVFGFRIIVDSEADCYRALGIVHMRWSVVPGRFKDYISTPKQNDYRSIHTTIVGPVAATRRTSDPHAPDAGRGRAWCGGAYALQGCIHR
jgi:guanosine-3',5'-bis(diphosphate) 3'-pyrophosphohydrolase